MFKLLECHGSTNSQKFRVNEQSKVLGQQQSKHVCAKQIGYLPENLRI